MMSAHLKASDINDMLELNAVLSGFAFNIKPVIR